MSFCPSRSRSTGTVEAHAFRAGTAPHQTQLESALCDDLQKHQGEARQIERRKHDLTDDARSYQSPPQNTLELPFTARLKA